MGKNIICFFNQSSIHYRQNIYMLMDKELPCDFYFGNSRSGGVKFMDESLLINNKTHLTNIMIGPFLWQKGAINLLRKYDIVITPGETFCLSTWVILLLSRIFRKKVYLWTHGAYGNERGFKKFLTVLRTKLCAGAFLYGEYARNILINYGCKPNKLHLVYNSLDYDQQLLLRSNIHNSEIYIRHFGNNNPVLIMIGRLNIRKKLSMLIDVVAELKKKGEEYNVVLVGDGEDRERLENLVSKNQVNENVWFFGACYDEKTNAELIFNADLCVVPGDIGLTAMHCMMFGLPVITHNNYYCQGPEFEAIIPGVTGDFFENDNIEDMSKVINNWFSNNINNRDAVRQACYKIIDERYNPHVQVEVMRNAINN